MLERDQTYDDIRHVHDYLKTLSNSGWAVPSSIMVTIERIRDNHTQMERARKRVQTDLTETLTGRKLHKVPE